MSKTAIQDAHSKPTDNSRADEGNYPNGKSSGARTARDEFFINAWPCSSVIFSAPTQSGGQSSARLPNQVIHLNPAFQLVHVLDVRTKVSFLVPLANVVELRLA
jgi:hypothetical protein